MVLASTYPRWRGDKEPGFVHELAKRLVDRFRVIAVFDDRIGRLKDGRIVEVMGIAQKAGLNRIGFVANAPATATPAPATRP